ncbi:uncharacterized protein V1510DRAFT_412798 [Dipodascopsis tothii]|uniref:uncharacterized protein n=1 Tax=Dipodascopsis tothii TaxID=44089 RepID=UPI0034CF709F
MFSVARRSAALARARALQTGQRAARPVRPARPARSVHSLEAQLKTDDVTFMPPRRSLYPKKVDVATNTGRLVILQPPAEAGQAEALAGDAHDAAYAVKNRGHVVSLLDACISSNELQRAELIIKRAHNILSPEEYLAGYNAFLLAVTENVLATESSFSKPLALFDSLSADADHVEPDDRSFAIVISGAARLADAAQRQSLVKSLVADWRVKRGRDIGEVLRHEDLFPLLRLGRVIGDAGLTERDVAADFRYLFEALSGPERAAEEAHEQETAAAKHLSLNDKLLLMSRRNAADAIEDLPPDVDKDGVQSLDPVQSYGLKNLRAALQGVASGERPPLPVYGADGDRSRPEWAMFTEMDEQLATLAPEDRARYTEAFESYNTERQRALERLALHSAKRRWQHDYDEMHARGDINIKKINPLLWEWHNGLKALIDEELVKVKDLFDRLGTTDINDTPRANAVIKKLGITDDVANVKERFNYGPYLRLVESSKLSVITMLEIIKLHSTGGVVEGMRTARAVLAVGRAVEMEYNADRLLNSEAVGRVARFAPKKQSRTEMRKTVAAAKRRQQTADTVLEPDWRIEWPADVKAKIGSVLISMFMHVAKISVSAVDPVSGERVYSTAPALYHTYQYTAGNRLGVIKFHKDLARMVSSDPASGTIHPQQLPMLVEPKPWTSWTSGGYYYSKVPIMRTKDSVEQMAYLKEASMRDNMKNVYKGLDVLGKSAWAINEKVFRVLSQVWNSGEAMLDIPKKLADSLEFPAEPDKSADPSVRRDWVRQCKRILRERQVTHSQRCDTNYKLEVARSFLGERIYFPHNIDFRGRAYAIPPHLNHLGNDMCRGLLTFWEKRELGSVGFRWLKIHLANVYGYDKASFDEREQFADDNVANIFDSADRPLDGSRWWQKADDPWQCLAVCFELADALRSPDPLKFRSRLPVHQDGTCNGLQHYAALGGDIEGATQVNLVPSDRPQDVYTHVAGLVQQKVARDAAAGHEIAKVLDGKISRKVVKQTVMTNVYGVTFIGARLQIMGQLKDRGDVPADMVWQAGSYLTRYVFDVIRGLFSGAHEIQDWLGECARRISKSVYAGSPGKGKTNKHMTSVIWTTPLGLPVVQPYRASVRKQVATMLQTVYISDPYNIHPVNGRKQMAAFPPNYVHSLDATHMLLSAIACGEQNLTFAAVHDSYWTHAADVDTMSAILRDAFIKLHEVDLIAKLKEEFEERYRGHMHAILIKRNSPEAVKISAMRKALKAKLKRDVTVQDEIDLERERQELLASADPADVQKAKKIVTSVSVLEGKNLEPLLFKHASRAGAVGLRSSENSQSSAERDLKQSYDETEMDDEMDVDLEAEAVEIEKETKSSAGVLAFVPLKFPDVPKKGEFDVKLLKDSKYFFS